ncbi:lamin tail domain-containing protein [Candidatus Uhrbacteria bacterium]|jgi:trimeric autotransporter adhesin|nr:lamin tail domain-containing protein [Candidatus Uhrbacteria bacterium]MBT7717124.1 lamin tail domain-containing protein [Candidatus Uhrbacteria bacterium]
MQRILYGLFCLVFFVLAIPASAQETPQTTSESADATEVVLEESTEPENPDVGAQTSDEGSSSVEESDSEISAGTSGDESATYEPAVEGEQSTEDEAQNPVEESTASESESTEVDQSETDTATTDESEVESASVEDAIEDPELVEAVEDPEPVEGVEVPDVFISEVNWAGSELSQADEWLELYNAHGADMDISGWILTGCATSGDALAIADGTMLAAGDVLLVSNYDLGHEKTTLVVQPDLVTASLSLSNSALEIMLVMPDGTVVDTAGDGSAPPAGSTSPKVSMQRDFGTLQWYNSELSSNLSNTDQLGTPGVLYAASETIKDDESDSPSIPSEADLSAEASAKEEGSTETEETGEVDQGSLIINEFVSNPMDDQEEWIEVYNPTDNSIELEDWTVRDATERSSSFDQTSIEADGYALIYSPSGQLNNGGDTVELLNPNGDVVSSVTYGTELIESPEKGYALALIENDWTLTSEQTPGSMNVFSDEVIVEEETGQSSLFINEFVSDPTDDQEEWIEIYNPTDNTIELEGWTVRDATERSSIFDQISIGSNDYAVIYSPAGQLNNGGDTIELINSEGETVSSITYGSDEIEAPEKGYALAFIENVWTVTTEPTLGATNVFSEEVIEDTDSSVIPSEADLSAEASAKEEGSTEAEEETEETIEDTNSDVIPSEAEEAKSYESGMLIITELVSDPAEGEVEWVEVYNTTDTAIDLTGWSLTDATDRSTDLENSIEAGGYFVIEEPKGKLNNGGDSVNLYDPSGNLINSMSYGTEEIDDPSKGESLALIDDQWTITSEITKSESNKITYEEESTDGSEQQTTQTATTNESASGSNADQSAQYENVQDDQPTSTGNDNDVSDKSTEAEVHRVVAIAETPKTTTSSSSSSSSSSKSSSSYSSASANDVTLSGIVTATPGIFGSQIAFIEGAQLYFYYADWPLLQIGDVVTVTGELSESRGEQRIKLSETGDVQVTGHVDLYPTSTSINGLDSLIDGSLITIRGEIADISDAKIVLQDTTGDVVIVASDGMQWSSMSSELEITGVLRTISGEQRVYPRTSQDVVQIQKEVVEDPNDDVPVVVAQSNDIAPWIGGGLLLAALLALGYFFVRRTNLQTAPAGA